MKDRFIIVGAGFAGLSAAICMAEHGCKSILVSLQPSERAQSVLAEGGISGELSRDERDLYSHYKDTLQAGEYLADACAVKGLVMHAPDVIHKLAGLGVPFNMREGQLMQRQMGGHSRRRTCFAKDSTGKVIMNALIDEVRKYEAQGMITRLSHHTFLEFVLQGKDCIGCLICDCYTEETLFLNGKVLLASGGMSGMFPGCTTGTVYNDGMVAAAALWQGVELCNLEFIQYHPTTIASPGKRCLISEAARSEGGRLFINRKGKRWYFMEESCPEYGNLAPRDVISREMLRVCSMEDCESQVYLDMTTVKKEVWTGQLHRVREECIRYLNKDPIREAIPIDPGIHYFMGGIRVDEDHRTNKRFLYAAGECACQYHGANRLGGNSILGALYGGWKAAKSMMEDGKMTENINELPEYLVACKTIRWEIRHAVSDVLVNAMGIIRTEAQLTKGIEMLQSLYKKNLLLAEKKQVLLAQAMLQSALFREESRGAHYRCDYPDTLKQYQKNTIVRYDGSNIQVELQEKNNP